MGVISRIAKYVHRDVNPPHERGGIPCDPRTVEAQVAHELLRQLHTGSPRNLKVTTTDNVSHSAALPPHLPGKAVEDTVDHCAVVDGNARVNVVMAAPDRATPCVKQRLLLSISPGPANHVLVVAVVPEQRLVRDDEICITAHCLANDVNSRPDAGHDPRAFLIRHAVGNLVTSGCLVDLLTRPWRNPQAVSLHSSNYLINAHRRPPRNAVSSSRHDSIRAGTPGTHLLELALLYQALKEPTSAGP